MRFILIFYPTFIVNIVFEEMILELAGTFTVVKVFLNYFSSQINT